MQKISIGAVLAAVVLVCCAITSFAQAPFNPAAVTSASDIPYPIQSIADGVVVLDVSIDAKAHDWKRLRDTALTSPATSSIQSKIRSRKKELELQLFSGLGPCWQPVRRFTHTFGGDPQGQIRLPFRCLSSIPQNTVVPRDCRRQVSVRSRCHPRDEGRA